jgi:hypothetical protein
MHDFPEYGVASFLQTQRYYGCLLYGLEEVLLYSILELEKVIHYGYRNFSSSWVYMEI